MAILHIDFTPSGLGEVKANTKEAWPTQPLIAVRRPSRPSRSPSLSCRAQLARELDFAAILTSISIHFTSSPLYSDGICQRGHQTIISSINLTPRFTRPTWSFPGNTFISLFGDVLTAATYPPSKLIPGNTDGLRIRYLIRPIPSPRLNPIYVTTYCAMSDHEFGGELSCVLCAVSRCLIPRVLLVHRGHSSHASCLPPVHHYLLRRTCLAVGRESWHLKWKCI